MYLFLQMNIKIITKLYTTIIYIKMTNNDDIKQFKNFFRNDDTKTKFSERSFRKFCFSIIIQKILFFFAMMILKQNFLNDRSKGFERFFDDDTIKF